MDFSLSSSLVGNAVSNPDKLALDLQFATDKTLTARKGPNPVFTRGSSATFVDSNGLIKYGPENLLLQSENFGTTWGNNTGNSLVLNDALSPTGTLTADKIDFPATAATNLNRAIQQSLGTAFNNNGPITASVWLKTVSGTSTVYITLLDGSTTWVRSHTACNVTTAWTRFSVTLPNSTASLFFAIGPDTRTSHGTPVQPPVQSAASVHAWGAQLERSSTARTYNPTTTAAFYGPRFDHDPVTGVCKGLLMEESRTNLCVNSNLLTSASWIPTGTTVVTDAAGPDGANAFEVAETVNTSNHNIGNSGSATSVLATSVVSGTNYTGSMFFKKVVGNIDWVQLSLGSGGFGTAQYANFNIGNGAVGNFAGLASGTSPQIQNYGNGWYRCSITVPASVSSTTSANIVAYFTNNIDTTARGAVYAGNTANKVITAMGQFEAGSFPTSYIPTVAASAIRSADVCSITGSNFSGFYNQPEGTLFADVTPQTVDQLSVAVGVNTSASTRSHFIYKTNSAINAAGRRWGAQTVNDAGAQTAIPTSTDVAISRFRLAYGYKLNDFAFAYAGVIVGTDTIGTIPVPTTMRIGSRDDGLYINGHIASVRYYKKRLLNAKLQAITV